MAAAKHPKGEQLASGGTHEVRSMVALEHIALNLEAIEGHLAQIADALGDKGTSGRLVTEVQRLWVEVSKAAAKR